MRGLNEKIVLYFSQILNAGLLYFLSFYMAREVSKENLGEYLYFFSISVTCVGLVSSPYGMILTRSKNKSVSYRLAIRRMWEGSSIAILVGGCALLLLDKQILGLSTCYGGVLLYFTYFSFMWNSERRRLLYSFSSVLPNAARAICIVVFTSVSLNTAGALMKASILALAMSCMIVIFFGRRAFDVDRPNFKKVCLLVIRRNAKLIWSMAASSFIFILYKNSDKVVAERLIGFKGVAEISIAVQWSYTVITTALQPIMTLIYPGILQGSIEHSIKETKKYCFLISISTIALSAFAAIAHRYYQPIFPAGYKELANLTWAGILAGGIFVAAQVISVNFSKQNNEIYHLISMSIPVIVIIPTMWIMAKIWAVEGLIYGHLIFSILYLLVCFVIFNKIKNVAVYE